MPPITLTPTPTSVVTNVTLPDTTTLPKSQKRSWYEKTVDAILTYHKNKFDRDIAIAQANGQIREPEVNQEQIRHVRPLETFGAEFGRTTEDLADFLRRNILVVGLVTLGVILFLRDPKKGK
ncbi:MAG: hypothetical protein N3A69_00135 [Leptospiraceae bacterium]|nr:hypothetical protein [Leptospiraceae bacterium]